MKGHITKEFTVWCGNCNEWNQETGVDTQANAVKKFKAEGWVQNRQYGWLCNTCRTKLYHSKISVPANELQVGDVFTDSMRAISDITAIEDGRLRVTTEYVRMFYESEQMVAIYRNRR